MEKALTKVSSVKITSLWISKKAKEELSNISQDLNILSNTVEEKAKWIFNKLKGTSPKTLPELLQEYNLPPGLFPQNITCFEFEESRAKLIVHLASPCEVTFKDGSVIRYANRVKAILLRGKLTGIEGMKTKLLVWVKLTCVAADAAKTGKLCLTAGKLCFTAGVKNSRPKDVYLLPIDGVRVREF